MGGFLFLIFRNADEASVGNDRMTVLTRELQCAFSDATFVGAAAAEDPPERR